MLYLALAEENLYDCIRPEKKHDWEKMRKNDCRDSFRADSKTNFFPRAWCSVHKKHNKREPGLVKEEFRWCTETLCSCSKTYCCYDNQSDKMKFSCKVLSTRIVEEPGDGPMENYRKVLDKAINLTLTIRQFRTINHMVATYKQIQKALSYFYPKRLVQDDGIHIRHLNL